MSVTSYPIVELPGDKSDFLVVGNPTIPAFIHDAIQWNLDRVRVPSIHLNTQVRRRAYFDISHEIETLSISPALVVLSSCDSGRGQVKAEGVIGMARAFLSAGAYSVLVSLWRVSDESANVFMQQYFYQYLVNSLPSFKALQRSMQRMRCFHKYSHFVSWSRFHIIGKKLHSSVQFPIDEFLGETHIFL